MSARKLTARGVVGGLIGFVGMSVVAGLLVTAAVTPAVAVTGMAATNTIGVFEGLPEYLKIAPLATRSTMYATKDGKPVQIAAFYSQNRIIDSWAQVNQLVKDAAVSAEDAEFYEHGAINVQGTVRAAISNTLHPGAEIQGGSSITQQYVKNVRLQTCEQYNVLVPQTGTAAQQKKAQAAMTAKYKSCYYEYTQQTNARKIQEMKLAIGVEKKYSKQQILLGYLNIAGFGGQVYGIETAARYYFGTTAAKLTLAQAATLVAIVNNPNNLRIDAPNSKDNGKKVGYVKTRDRRNYVLEQMLKNKKISEAQFNVAVHQPITPKITPQPSGCAQAAAYDAAFYCNAVMYEMRNNPVFGKTQDARDDVLSHGGLKIYTSLNLDLQNEAQQQISSYFPATKPGLDLGAADVSVELNTGRVVMAVQNRPYNTSTTPVDGETQTAYAFDYNHGGSSGFQTGSTYKAFSLVEWLKEGHSLNDVVNAPTTKQSIPQSRYHASCAEPGPSSSGVWSMGNDSAGEGGLLSVLRATQLSVNTAFAVMGQRLDLCGIRNDAKALGVKPAYPYAQTTNSAGQLVNAKDSSGKLVPSYLEDNVSSILGTNYVAPVDMAVAYAGIANLGKTCSPVYIDKVIGSDNKQMAVPKTTCTQAISQKVAAAVVYALHTPLQGDGTGAAANPGDNVPIMGKTGTTDAYGQNWLVTSTTKVANAIWAGNVQATSIGGVAQYTDFRTLSFNGVAGNRVKFAAVKPILQTLNATYHGDNWPSPDDKLLNGVQITVPDLTGKSTADAKSSLAALGFTYQDAGDQDSSQAQGTVASTNPAAGTKLSQGSAVQVYTSKGNKVQLPQVVGRSLSDALAQLKSAGVDPQVVGDDSGATDKVIAQSPGSGSVVDKGSTVKLRATGTDSNKNDDNGDDDNNNNNNNNNNNHNNRNGGGDDGGGGDDDDGTD